MPRPVMAGISTTTGQCRPQGGVGKKEWRKRVVKAMQIFDEFLFYDKIYVGGGNAKHLSSASIRTEGEDRANTASIPGGIRIWDLEKQIPPVRRAAPNGPRKVRAALLGGFDVRSAQQRRPRPEGHRPSRRAVAHRRMGQEMSSWLPNGPQTTGHCPTNGHWTPVTRAREPYPPSASTSFLPSRPSSVNSSGVRTSTMRRRTLSTCTGAATSASWPLVGQHREVAPAGRRGTPRASRIRPSAFGRSDDKRLRLGEGHLGQFTMRIWRSGVSDSRTRIS